MRVLLSSAPDVPRDEAAGWRAMPFLDNTGRGEPKISREFSAGRCVVTVSNRKTGFRYTELVSRGNGVGGKRQFGTYLPHMRDLGRTLLPHVRDLARALLPHMRNSYAIRTFVRMLALCTQPSHLPCTDLKPRFDIRIWAGGRSSVRGEILSDFPAATRA